MMQVSDRSVLSLMSPMSLIIRIKDNGDTQREILAVAKFDKPHRRILE